nr:MAG TPA: hypothetical protein [Caudoviricetes sp.]
MNPNFPIIVFRSTTTLSDYFPNKEKYVEDRVNSLLDVLEQLNNPGGSIDIDSLADGTYAYELSVILSAIVDYYKKLQALVYDYYDNLYGNTDLPEVKKKIDYDLEELYNMFFHVEPEVFITPEELTVQLRIRNALLYLQFLEERQ